MKSGIDLGPGHSTMAYRTLGSAAAVERFGCGFMDKSGVREDQIRRQPGTYSLICILRGRGTYISSDGKRWPMNAGDCFQRQPDREQSTLLDPNSRWLECFLDIGPTLYHALSTMQILRHQQPVWHPPPDARREERFWNLLQLLAHASETELPQALGVVMQLLTDCLPHAADPEPGSIDQACRWLGEGLSEQRDLQTYCQLHDLGYEAFRKRFRRQVGLSPHQYRIRRRLDRACELLTGSNWSITRIAEQLGYTSAFEFSNQFRKHIGIAPSHMRQG